jgi:hypothetical protein
MSRGLFVLAIQLLLCGTTVYLGIWTLIRPKSFQDFVHENFGLLPSVKSGIRLTPLLIRLSSVYLLWYAYTLSNAYTAEILWLAHIVSRLSGLD